MLKLILLFIYTLFDPVFSNDVLGCGGFIKSHVPIDFAKVEIKLLTKQGILKDKTNCAPNNGYYFLPLYDKGEYILELEPPPGWSFTPNRIELNIDGASDLCSKGNDINFHFQGFGITGKVESLGSQEGPEGITVELKSNNEQRTTTTDKKGNFLFTPLFPGNYVISVSHSKWKIYKKTVNVKVMEGNTELPSQSLLIQGYDVSGRILSEGEPLKNAFVLLYQKNEKSNTLIDGCIKDTSGLNLREKPVCYTTTNDRGIFTFGIVPNGQYYVKPHFQAQNIHFEPDLIEFSVQHGSLELDKQFEIIGLTVPGKVLKTEQGRPIENAKIFLNGKEITKTDAKGQYKLEKLKAGSYKLKAESENVQFNEQTVKIHPNIQALPTLLPTAFKVCGKVISDKSYTVSIFKVGSTSLIQTKTKNERFCEYLPLGKYDVQVTLDPEDRQSGIQFFPLNHLIQVDPEYNPEIVFSQLKAKVSGKIQFINKEDYEGLRLIMESSHEKKEIVVKGNSYSIEDVVPGVYKVKVISKRLCFQAEVAEVNVNSAEVTVPTFIQLGYLVHFTSTHPVTVKYKAQNNDLSAFVGPKGESICLPKPGEYKFNLDSCHVFEPSTISFTTTSKENSYKLTPIRHRLTVRVESDDFGPVDAQIELKDSVKDQKLLYDSATKTYKVDLYLEEGEVATVTPKSDILYFIPKKVLVTGKSDCQELQGQIKAVKGKVYSGKVKPALAGVKVTVTSDDESLTVETDSEGVYKFPALDSKKHYEVTAVRDNYVFSGPNSQGDFEAHKLAEVVVEVLDKVDKAPLQGALLSLSGGESYRSNLQTDANGQITFNSLKAGEYFLKPMMKEYIFEPSSKIIPVKEGQTIRVQLAGTRVAYSVFGQVISLNGEPEVDLVVVAEGTGNCSHLSEESASESSGQFRIRGLQPHCSYNVKIKGSLEEKFGIDRAVPELIQLENVKQDIKEVKIVVFRPVQNVDVMVKIFSNNVNYYKSLKLKVTRETSPSGIVQSLKLDNPNLKYSKEENNGIIVHLPPIPYDHKTYSMYIESPLNVVNSKAPQAYFVANSSFKYVVLNYASKTATIEQQLKQTSPWTLISILILFVVFYNIQAVVEFLKARVNFNSNLLNVQTKWAQRKPEKVDDTDIDQIVQSINNLKKKPKAKKC